MARNDEEQEVELTQVDQWLQDQARAAATKEEGAAQVRWGLSCGAGASLPSGWAHEVLACLCSTCCPQPWGLTGRPTAVRCMT